MSDDTNETKNITLVKPATLLVALNRNGEYNFGWIGMHRGWFADDETLARNGTRLVEFVPGRVVAPAQFVEALSTTSEAVVRYSMRTGEDGEYELLRHEKYVGEILFYDEAQIVLSALKRAGMAPGGSKTERADLPLHPYSAYKAVADTDGKYVLYRNDRVIGRHLNEDDAKNVVAALADTHGAEAVICVPGESVATVGSSSTSLADTPEDDGGEAAYMSRLAQDDYVELWKRTPRKDRPSTHRSSPVGAVIDYLRSLDGTLMDAPFSREELGVAISALERVGKPAALETDGESHAEST